MNINTTSINNTTPASSTTFSQVVLTITFALIVIILPFTVQISSEPVSSNPIHDASQASQKVNSMVTSASNE